jgi:gamma-D-glutamyl-L-lysine dipeptidyl-peptidase
MQDKSRQKGMITAQPPVQVILAGHRRRGTLCARRWGGRPDPDRGTGAGAAPPRSTPGADGGGGMIEELYAIIEAVRSEFAPDPRTAVFEVDAARDGAQLVLFGAISVPAAAEELQRRVAALELRQGVRDVVVRLPEPGAADRAHGIVVAATAPMLAGPVVSESHLSQVVLGNRVLVLREHGRWLQCRSVDGYLGWVHRGYLRRVHEREARAWDLGANAPLHLSLGAEVRDRGGRVTTLLPWGARFGIRDSEAILPDGSTGKLVGPAIPVAELATKFPLDGGAIVATARLWTGTPYLWGGTTPWGADCSGFVQAVFRTHGCELPRDSDQQARMGIPIPRDQLDGLAAGDLLFFSEAHDRISHVAISTGGPRVIHAALGNGGVAENDLAGDRGYERELLSLLVDIRRVTARPLMAEEE